MIINLDVAALHYYSFLPYSFVAHICTCSYRCVPAVCLVVYHDALFLFQQFLSTLRIPVYNVINV